MTVSDFNPSDHPRGRDGRFVDAASAGAPAESGVDLENDPVYHAEALAGRYSRRDWAVREVHEDMREFAHLYDLDAVAGELVTRDGDSWVVDWMDDDQTGFEALVERHARRTVSADTVFHSGGIYPYVREFRNPPDLITRIHGGRVIFDAEPDGMYGNVYPVISFLPADRDAQFLTSRQGEDWDALSRIVPMRLWPKDIGMPVPADWTGHPQFEQAVDEKRTKLQAEVHAEIEAELRAEMRA